MGYSGHFKARSLHLNLMGETSFGKDIILPQVRVFRVDLALYEVISSLIKHLLRPAIEISKLGGVDGGSYK